MPTPKNCKPLIGFWLALLPAQPKIICPNMTSRFENNLGSGPRLLDCLHWGFEASLQKQRKQGTNFFEKQHTLSLASSLVHTERAKRNVTSAWRSAKNGNNCCQGECLHRRLKQKQIMERMSIFRAATHHVSCVDGGSGKIHPGPIPFLGQSRILVRVPPTYKLVQPYMQAPKLKLLPKCSHPALKTVCLSSK